MLRFWGVTASVFGANSPLFGWICVNVELNKDLSYILVMELCRGGIKSLETSCVDCIYAVELCCRLNTIVMHNMDVMHNGSVPYRHSILRDYEADMCILWDHSTDMCILWDHSTDMCIPRDHETDMCIFRDHSTDMCIHRDH
ncbi:hypothetical protein E5676_scaffold234G00210 [Cucumis melo var. makuwa]|uniref:Uncharacterized protein n=1 Tax=Cucumis melo var. makuwa TaxID=1194695 RepID=A0A5D3BFV3_CUCMM|nr:hypothetical protein E6C27_scaffold60G00610 [Cucumis melo var. makuwa]TYJ97929.1 hypothetical protein E5676_scaffold234G00210 [Cucumis melo var. makuwa]